MEGLSWCVVGVGVELWLLGGGTSEAMDVESLLGEVDFAADEAVVPSGVGVVGVRGVRAVPRHWSGGGR